jgi:hypothetical protein
LRGVTTPGAGEDKKTQIRGTTDHLRIIYKYFRHAENIIVQAAAAAPASGPTRQDNSSRAQKKSLEATQETPIPDFISIYSVQK